MKEKTCCFFGHRKISETEELKSKLIEIIEKLIVEKQVDTFLFGSKSRFNSLCLELVTELKEKYPYWMYNSIVNLQMLDANENESKGKIPLKNWVENELKKTNNRKQFFDSHLIPDIDLEQSNFDEFYQKRKEILSKKLKDIL